MDEKMDVKPPIADLHCDLLCYLQHNPERSPYDPMVRCSIPQLKQGNVKIQIMAIFTETKKGSSEKGFAQCEIFKSLSKTYSEVFHIPHTADEIIFDQSSPFIHILPAIENLSSFCEEPDDLQNALKKLDVIQRKIGKFLYASLTWNTENRFGGGCNTEVGLKNDGKEVVRYLNQKGIAVDLSHASDRLAYEIINFIDQEKLSLSIIASHSNFRAVTNHPRNLPDDLAKEIIKRNGIIGLNFVRYFVGEDSPSYFSRQLEHAVLISGGRGICFGADFFYGMDVSPMYQKAPEKLFFPSYDHSGTYPKVLELWRKANTNSEILESVCYQNLFKFIQNRF